MQYNTWNTEAYVSCTQLQEVYENGSCGYSYQGKKFSSNLREVMEYIKYSKDKDKLSELLKDNPRMVIDRDAAMVIKTITNTPIEIEEGMEEIDMCKAIDSLLTESRERGIELGELSMLVQLVKEGDLKPERAAAKAGMTVEQFEKEMESILLQEI